MNSLNPDLDGVDHINVYSKGLTKLGQFLTNFACSPFSHPEHGKFASIEAYWYWLGCTHKDRDKLKPLWGFEAKKIGRELNALDWQEDPEFKQNIKKAMYAKIFNNPEMALELKQSTLPLRHYYNYKGKIVEPQEGVWIIDFLTELRKRMNSCANLIYRKGNLFEAPEGVCLVQSCNTLGNWGAGIALEFKKRFPGTYRQQRSLCQGESNKSRLLGHAHLNHENGYKIGSLFVSSGDGQGRSSQETILMKTASSVNQLCLEPGINELWIPLINAGLFKVPWELTEVVLIGILIRRPDIRLVISEID